MIKIALIGARLSESLGGCSLLVGTTQALSKVFPDAEYILFVPERSYKDDLHLAAKYKVQLEPLCHMRWAPVIALLRRCTGLLIGPASVKATIKKIEESDVVISIFGIMFADTLGSSRFLSCMYQGFRFLVCKILGKPVIKYTTDLGPFNARWNRFFAKFYLNYCIDFILVRSEASLEELKKLNAKTPVKVVPDTAFLFPAEQSDISNQYRLLRNEHSLIGISVSFQARNHAKNPDIYVTVMKNFIRYLLSKNYVVVIIPNDLGRKNNDDREVAEQIHAGLNTDQCQILCTEKLSAPQIKGVIEHCEVVVACRYHSVVASLSLGIPTLAIGWHHKYAEVLRLFDQERWICDVEEITLEKLTDTFDNLWNERDEVRKTIISALPRVKAEIFEGAKDVHDFVVEKLGNKL